MNSLIPTVSVVIPAYNREKYIGECIESCLSQNSPDMTIEVIVVDDGSEDTTATVAESFGSIVRCLHNPTNMGRNVARNRGLEICAGLYVKFLDSDDILLPRSLENEFKCAREIDADIVVSGWCNGRPGGSVETDIRKCQAAPRFQNIIDDILAGKAVPTSAALYRRTMVEDLRWDTTLRKIDDWDWFIRSALRARIICNWEGFSYVWRQHPQQGIHACGMLENAIEFYEILVKLENMLAEEGMLTGERRLRLGQYLYKELRVLALHDRPAFESAIQHIYELDPRFRPRDEERAIGMRLACGLLGTRNAILLHCLVKRAIMRIRGPALNC